MKNSVEIGESRNINKSLDNLMNIKSAPQAREPKLGVSIDSSNMDRNSIVAALKMGMNDSIVSNPGDQQGIDKVASIKNFAKNISTKNQLMKKKTKIDLRAFMTNGEGSSQEQAIKCIIDEIWDQYDDDYSGDLDKEECRNFVRDALGNV